MGFGVEPVGGAGDLVLETAGAEQAEGDACQNHWEVAGAEGTGEAGDFAGDGALAERREEVLAVVDELADEREQTAGVAWRGWVGRGGRGGHGRKEARGGGVCQGKFT